MRAIVQNMGSTSTGFTHTTFLSFGWVKSQSEADQIFYHTICLSTSPPLHCFSTFSYLFMHSLASWMASSLSGLAYPSSSESSHPPICSFLSKSLHSRTFKHPSLRPFSTPGAPSALLICVLVKILKGWWENQSHACIAIFVTLRKGQITH